MTSEEPPDEARVAEPGDHDTLNYLLLGPSLTKAGQDTVDQQKVSEIIYNASKGSKYFNNQEKRDKSLTKKIERIMGRYRQLVKLDLGHDHRRADEYIAQLELERDLTQTVVHIDCDAFYAAVEELDRPELKEVPMAVGQGVLTTCNYHARKFGCRSGMAGFVAKKLCPSLICLPLNFDKYIAKAEEVREILVEYDPRFESASMDEAYLNITAYCQEKEMKPEEAITQLRNQVCEKTKITVSAGIAANAKIAKIASNRNKPNGQFRVASDRTTIVAFMRDLPTRKVNGIGHVFERELDAIGVKTCGDIYEQRAYLSKLFGEKAFQFLMTCYLGVGRTRVQPAEEYDRKSVGTESTFKDMGGKQELRDKLRWTAEELEGDLARTQFKGRTLVLKVKLHTYEVYTRQVIPPKAIKKADDLYRYSLPMLVKLEEDRPGFKLRLMGLRVTHLVSTKKTDLDFFGMATSKRPQSDDNNVTVGDDGSEWQVWPDEEFEEAARQERQTQMQETESLSQEHHDANKEEEGSTSYRRHGKEILPNPVKERNCFAPTSPEKEALWNCPICFRPQAPNDKQFNDHIDYCLSKQTIKEAVKETSSSATARGKENVRSEVLESRETKRRRIFES